jgi:methylmalonyl-CoA mutase
MPFQTKNKIRIVTAASLFDGHDAAINIMRRILQSKGAEIIHLGHNRSVAEIVECAIEEDVQGIAITSYQGGHVEFFTYMKDLLEQNGCGHIKIFGGGGGTILPEEIEALQAYGIARIYSPDDGRRMGLEGMIEDLLRQCDFPLNGNPAQFTGPLTLGEEKDVRRVARAISNAENLGLLDIGKGKAAKTAGKHSDETLTRGQHAVPAAKPVAQPVIGITGTGGAGKSSVTDEIVRRFLAACPDKTIAVVSVDPSKKKTGGALLGDRIRMNAIHHPRVYMRSLATRENDKALSAYVDEAIVICKDAGYDLIILESAGVGQSDASILDHCDISLYVMTPEYGAPSQLEKINMLDYANVIAVNKFDKAGALDALTDVRKQYKRNHGLWTAKDDELPVIGTMASHFNDPGTNRLFSLLMQELSRVSPDAFPAATEKTGTGEGTQRTTIIPGGRSRYLSEIAENIQEYNQLVEHQASLASRIYQLQGALETLRSKADASLVSLVEKEIEELTDRLTPVSRKLVTHWPEKKKAYEADAFEYKVRDKVISQPMYTTSLSGTRIPKVVLPKYRDWGDILRWQAQENVPGHFPFTAGVFPLKREGEDPTRMFAGEGGPERTNKRFHYVSLGQPAKRLSTAFDSVTLYGEDPATRPDIYGKVGNSGVSVATVDDAKKLYSGFDLCDPKTSVSMTINGPAPMILAFFMNAAIDQQCEKWITEKGMWAEVEEKINRLYAGKERPRYHNPLAPGGLPEGNDGLGLRLLGVSGNDVLDPQTYASIKARTLQQVRGTVQADILKEDQAQNTCIFSTEFALKLMGDVQEYFIRADVRNFYSVSISGYHIAEAGANPITQLAFTLANGFTYVEYYLSRGMQIDDFAPNLSFFFSNGMDPEYSVIGRVARRIWAKAMKYKYKANKRSQMLKYHIQTSGRSLHAQEIDFNDIRTTLQALYAIYDNCNSLHTNAYDEAITTPTEESVRRAMAIQLIINRELGTAKNENPNQGSFLMEELTDLVEQAVMAEFHRLTDRGGVLGAMERMYQRNKIQEESLYYENLKHTGELPVVGVNTFLNKNGSPTVTPGEVIRSSAEEKDAQIRNLDMFHKRNADLAAKALEKLCAVAVQNGNLFEELMETVKYCSLGEITRALYAVGGQYRRNM